MTGPLGTRAVLRDNKTTTNQDWLECAHCGKHVKFYAQPTVAAARRRGEHIDTHHVVCNVYVDGKWNRVEQFHKSCYAAAGEPHGPVDDSQPLPKR